HCARAGGRGPPTPPAAVRIVIPILPGASKRSPLAKGPSGNEVYILLLAPRPAGKARATSIPAAVCKERATQPAGLRAAARRGAAAGGHLRRCRSSTMPPHRQRRGALHLPARRSRQNAHLIFLRALSPCFQVQVA